MGWLRYALLFGIEKVTSRFESHLNTSVVFTNLVWKRATRVTTHWGWYTARQVLVYNKLRGRHSPLCSFRFPYPLLYSRGHFSHKYRRRNIALQTEKLSLAEKRTIRRNRRVPTVFITQKIRFIFQQQSCAQRWNKAREIQCVSKEKLRLWTLIALELTVKTEITESFYRL